MSDQIDVLLTYNLVENSAQPIIQNLTSLVSEPISFTVAAQGGFATCSLVLACDDITALGFLSEHLGRRIVLVNPLSPYVDHIVWEGMLYNVTVDDGKRSASRSVQNILNRVTVEYTEAVVIAGTYYEGETKSTATIDDTVSQAKYGIRELRTTAGVMTTAVAEQYRDKLLTVYKKPRNLPGGASVGGGGGQPNRVTLDCAGWLETLGQRFYSNTGTALVDTNPQIQAVLFTVGQFVATDYSNMSNSSVSYMQRLDESLPAREYIEKLVSIGATTGDLPMYFGIYENARPYFFAEPTVVKYRVARYDTSEMIVDATTGAVVPPWLVRPGHWCEITDFLPEGIETYTSLYENPRAFVIGTVDFRAPNVVRLQPVIRDPGELVLTRLDWASAYLEANLLRLEGPPQPYQPEPTPAPWWEIVYPIPLPGQPPPWANDPFVPGSDAVAPPWLNLPPLPGPAPLPDQNVAPPGTVPHP